MLTVETIGRIRREYFLKGKAIKEIARDLRVSRNTVRKVVRSGATSFAYDRDVQPRPKLGRWTAELDALLAGNEAKAAREQRTLIRIFEDLRGRGYAGGYDAVRRYARRWSKARGHSTAAVYVPLTFAPGEAYQFDWSHEVVLLRGVTVIVKAAHVRLCHSRMPFVRVYPRETQEMVFDAHDRAFALFKGACRRGIYDNMKTAVETILVGPTGCTIGASCRCVATTWSSRWPAHRPPAGRRGKSRTRSGSCGSAFSRPGCASRPTRSSTPGCSTNASPTPRRIAIPRCPARRSGRCSRRNARNWSPMPGGSTASTRCRPRCRRPAWCASTTTSTRWPPTRSAGRSKYRPMPTAS